MHKWQTALKFIGMGWYIGLSITGGTLGGLWLDNKLGTKPVFIIIGLITGIIVAFYGVYKMIIPLMKNDKDKGDS
jgi:F0F1-type ATP synthase assembly protein I